MCKQNLVSRTAHAQTLLSLCQIRDHGLTATHECRNIALTDDACKGCFRPIAKQLCNNHVESFGQDNTSTIQTTDMFAEQYKHSQNAVFWILEFLHRLAQQLFCNWVTGTKANRSTCNKCN